MSIVAEAIQTRSHTEGNQMDSVPREAAQQADRTTKELVDGLVGLFPAAQSTQKQLYKEGGAELASDINVSLPRPLIAKQDPELDGAIQAVRCPAIFGYFWSISDTSPGIWLPSYIRSVTTTHQRFVLSLLVEANEMYISVMISQLQVGQIARGFKPRELQSTISCIMRRTAQARRLSPFPGLLEVVTS